MEIYSFYLPYHSYDKWKKILGYPILDNEKDNKIDVLIRFIMCRYPRLRGTGSALQLYATQVTLAEQIIELFAKPKMIIICMTLRKMGLINDIIDYIINKIPIMAKIS